MKYRICTKCNIKKAETEENFYYRNKKQKELGFVSECKVCFRKRALEYKRKNIDKARKWDLDRYYRNRESELIRLRNDQKKRKEERKLTLRRWYKNNPEKVREYQKRHRNHNISKQEWIDCKNYFNNQCACCGKTYEEQYSEFNEDFHKDHLYHNGRNDLKNCIPLCTSCNTSKGTKSINEWYKMQPFYSQERYHRIYVWIRYDCKKFCKKKI